MIAAVNGFALGGGMEICLACDLIVASETAFFGLPEVTHGLFAAGGGLPRIAQQVPPKIAARWALTGAPVAAQEAARWGLVNDVVPPDDLLAAALEFARTIAGYAPLAVQSTKRLIHETVTASAWEPKPWDAIDSEIDSVFSSTDAAVGTTAFAEKRPPVWRGI
ncbi:enoyl-CoA hydratase-related protein [Cryobacterium luteum]|uniref:enoyl-CoA hydratase-related protein n=1 Tax=Cryobacterium luteum TaxID=1424661 RepID=UPI002410E5E9|nr:enoyl-CoA hydratase-related protein [Cryobacterium luteum]